MLIDLPPPQDQPVNLALHAHATASEEYDAFKAALAIDGDAATRWSGIPGHNEGVWFELAWDAPIDVGCVVIDQYDRFSMEFDLEAWDAAANAWRPLQHFGRAGVRLPRLVLWRAEPVRTTRLRIAKITNGPSFNEVEVFAQQWPEPPAVFCSGDADGHLIGVVTDGHGSAPIGGVKVGFSGRRHTAAWQAEVSSDEHGLFQLAPPLDLEGALAVGVTLPSGRWLAAAPVNVDDLPLALTPSDSNTPRIDLGGTWRFAADDASAAATPPWASPDFDDRAWLAAPVPSHLVMHGLEPIDGVAAGRRHFPRPRWPAGTRAKLRFEGAYSGAEVFLNGVRCAAHEGGATPFEADVTALLRDGDNLLAVRLREHTDTSDRLDRMSQYADFPLLGIWRDVALFAVPAVHVAATAITTTREGEGRDAMLAVRVGVANESGEPFDGEVALTLTGPDGRAEPLSVAAAGARADPFTRADVVLAARVAAPAWWDAEHPNLHTLTVSLRRGGRELQQLTQRIGFRQSEVRGSEFLINGAPVKFRGTCHHDGRPLTGRVVTAAEEREDLELIRGANLNSLRTSHYPPHHALLDGADELGLYVEDEASFCWVGDADDLRLAPRILQLTAELVARDRNHPSVFMWSLCNESSFGWAFERSHEWVRRVDPSRPCGAAISATLELATAHNPITLERIAENEQLDRPLLFDESFCIFQGIFNDVGELWVDPGLRDLYVVPMRAIAESFFTSRATQGSMIWCYADDLFCVPGRGLEYGRSATRSHFVEPAYRIAGRGIVGDAPWGFVDGWRRRKPEYFHVKKLHSPVRVVTTSLPWPAAGASASAPRSVQIVVENRYDQTDLSQLKVDWTLGGERHTATLAAAPRSRATLVLPITGALADAAASGATLGLRFTDARGLEVEAVELPFVIAGGGAPLAPRETRDSQDLGDVALRIVPEGTLSGESTRIVGRGFELAFDRRSGALRRAIAGGAPVLVDWPAPHLLASGDALVPRPGPLPTRLDALEITASEASGHAGGARVVQRGAWGEFEGTIAAEVAADGTVQVESDLIFHGQHGPEVAAREFGLAFSLPLDATHLAWERDAEWSAYPSDHIGRPIGAADAFPAGIPTLAGAPGSRAPTWSFALDPSPMGSNDFRSTKRHVRRVALTSAQGGGIEIDSDAKQSARANVGDDRVRLFLLDVSEGTGVGWWEWEHNYGHGRALADGQHLQTKLTFRLLAPRASAPARR